MAVVVDVNVCIKEDPCPAMASCPVDALTQEGANPPAVDDSACIDCGVCCDACPSGALTVS